MNPTAAELRQLRRDNLAQGVALSEVPFEEWAAQNAAIRADRPRVAVWRSRTHLVQMFAEPAGMVRMSVQRTDWDARAKRFRDDIPWDDLQRLKAEAGYADRVALEVLPPDSLVVNVANMRHLWILPAGSERLPFVWKDAA